MTIEHKELHHEDLAAILAIEEVIAAETEAYKNKDFDAWADCFVQNDDTHDVLVSNVAGLSVHEGWPEVASHMKRAFCNGLTTDLVEFGRKNMRIKTCGDMAWAVFDSWSTTASGANLRSFDTRILQRIAGQWKIVFNSFIQREIEGVTGNFVGVDKKGKIVWASSTALEILKNHPVLMNASGRLLAKREEWTRVLLSAVASAANHHGFFETHRVADEFGGPARFPVVLGEDDGGGIAIAHMSIRDCITYVRVSGDGDLERRLRFAKTVYGLSPGQLRVAREVALGKGLNAIACNLSISATTARTHLNRIFAKTGVRNQTALVRLLLSVG